MMNMNSWSSLVLPWTSQKQPVLHREERVYWRQESQCQVITTPCETGCFPTQNCIELRHSIYNKGGTISHLLGDMALKQPAMCFPKEARIFLQQNKWVLVARTVGRNDNDNTELICKLLSSIPVIQDPVGLKMLISIWERAAYSCYFYYMKWHNNICRKVNLYLAPQILAFSFLFVCLFLAICDNLTVQASPELIASVQPLQFWDYRQVSSCPAVFRY